MPAYGVEVVSLINAGSDPLDIIGIQISDGEGVLSIEANYLLGPGEKMHLCSGEAWFDDGGLLLQYPSDAVSSQGRFTLADVGDEVMLRLGGVVLDVFVYGGGDPSIEGWHGPAFPKIGRGKAAVRIMVEDNNGSQDWEAASMGRSTAPTIGDEAFVEPFLFPDDAFFRIMRELSTVDEEVCISMYQLNNLSIAASLASLARKGIEVKILMEGSPVGGIDEEEQALFAALWESGCDLRFIRSADGFKRYDYLHNKYAIIDKERVLVTSENWQDSSLTNNRGWGVSIASTSLALELWRIFHLDFENRSWDIVDFPSRFPYAQPLSLPAYDFFMPPVVDVSVFPAQVELLLCPDNAYHHLQEAMEGAEDRLYVQQFYTQESWVSSESPLMWMMQAAEQGVDARLLLDSSWFSQSKDNSLVAQRLMEMSQVEAKNAPPSSGFSITHNKGAVIDDSVLVSSINWVDAAFFQNRELGVLVHSAEVASFFSLAFLTDWGEILEVFEASITVVSSELYAGRPLLVQANTQSGGRSVVNYSWDLDGDGVADCFGWRQVLQLSMGGHLIALTVTDDLGRTATRTAYLEVLPDPDKETIETGQAFYALLGLPSSYILYRLIRRRKDVSRQE